MSRLAIRVRLTVTFAVTMAVVLAAIGGFVYLRVARALEEQLDESLELRGETHVAGLGEDGARPTGIQLGSEDESAVQVLDAGGGGADALISAAEARRGRARAFFLTRDSLPPLGGHPARLLVTPVNAEGRQLVLVVAASLEDQEETLEELVAQLLVAGPLALVLATAAGYGVAGGALRPVEAMRRRAEDVSSERKGQRLPLPEARDEIRSLGETLNAMLARLEAGLERERRFVADASHELRTPLALLRTELELSLRRPRSAEALAHALRSAAEEVDRLTRLAEDLLVLARLDEGRLPLRREPLCARDLLESVAHRFASRAEAARRPLEVATKDDVPLLGDPLRLEQALGNLVDNGLRHGSGAVRLEASGSNGTVELRVTDEGDGFSGELLDRAFDRFASGDAARVRGSTGLGLSIVAAIARAHGGTARAVNLDGGGVAVSLLLPAG